MSTIIKMSTRVSESIMSQALLYTNYLKKFDLPDFLQINKIDFKGFNGIYEVHVVNLLSTIFGGERINCVFKKKVTET